MRRHGNGKFHCNLLHFAEPIPLRQTQIADGVGHVIQEVFQGVMTGLLALADFAFKKVRMRCNG